MNLTKTARLLAACLTLTLVSPAPGLTGLSDMIGVSAAHADGWGPPSGRPVPPNYRPPGGGGPGYRPPPPGYRPGNRPPPPGYRPGYRPPPPGYRPGYRPPPGGWVGPAPVPRPGWGYYRPGWAPPPAGYYYDNTGALIAAGMIGLAAGAIAGAALSQPSAPPPQQVITSDQIAACARRYRSYDPRTGTYLGNDGYRHPCP